MKTSAFLAAILCILSCSPYPKGLHDDCRLYLKKFRAQWHRLPNGFYICNDLAKKGNSPLVKNGELIMKEWENHIDCLSTLSPKEVKEIFGEPSNVQRAFNDLNNTNIENYFYIICDTECNPKKIVPYNMGVYDNNILWFVFFNGKQVDKYKPRLSLPCE